MDKQEFSSPKPSERPTGDSAGLGDGESVWMTFDSSEKPCPFDFDLPPWLFPPQHCPARPGEETPTLSGQEQQQFLFTRVFNVDEWLAAKGYHKDNKPARLGITFDAKARTVSRDGFDILVHLGRDAARLFGALLHAGPSGVPDYVLDGVYRGQASTRRKAISDLRRKLEPLGITISKRKWAIVEIAPRRK